MPDTAHPNTLPPGDWNAAFAALPTEAPPTDGWARLSRQLEVRETRRAAVHRRNRWLTIAAALALVALLPAMLMRERGTSPNRQADAIPVARTASDATPARSKAAGSTATSTPTAPAIANTASPPSVDAVAIAPQRAGRAPASDAQKASRTVARKRVSPAHSREVPTPIAVTSTPQATDQNDDVRSVAAADVTAATPVEADRNDMLMQLQAESARLEALIAMTRDDRSGSAAATVMTAELDQRIGLIDAGLTQSPATLTMEQREALWRERVQTLRTLAGVETTQLWLAAQGESFDGALVSVD